uniref:Uncharacterized protein n=1 Tax=Romanomermis culicivorax TaxID=13658 RepID=A0A915JWY9_ROMCU
MEGNETECSRHKVTERKRVRLGVTVGRFRQNCSYPFRPKVDFRAERFKLLAIRSAEKDKCFRVGIVRSTDRCQVCRILEQKTQMPRKKVFQTVNLTREKRETLFRLGAF